VDVNLLARNGAVTLDTNRITRAACAAAPTTTTTVTGGGGGTTTTIPGTGTGTTTTTRPATTATTRRPDATTTTTGGTTTDTNVPHPLASTGTRHGQATALSGLVLTGLGLSLLAARRRLR
jgi:hypothetical protein